MPPVTLAASQVRRSLLAGAPVRLLGVAVALGLLAALGGCATGTMGIYADILERAFSTPEDAEVSDAALAETPFAYSHARLGDSPQSVLVLAYREFGEDKWVSARGQMLVLRQGRIVRTTGLPMDLLATTASDPDPLGRTSPDALPGRAWIRKLDWADPYGAGYQARSEFIDRGEVEIIVRAGETRPARRIEERVTLEPGGEQFTNWFDLDRSGRVLRSHQYVHPALPPVTFTLVRDLPDDPALDEEPPEEQAAEVDLAGRVIVHRADGSRVTLPAGPQRLENLLLQAEDPGAAWWPGVRLYQVDAAARAEAQAARETLASRLEQVAARHRTKGDLSAAGVLERLVAELPPAPPGRRLELTLTLDQVRLDAALDKLMPPGEYLLVAAPRPEGVLVAGRVAHPGQRPHAAQRSASGYVSAERLLRHADPDYAWLVQPDGALRRTPVAYWNRERVLPMPGAVLFIAPGPAVLGRDHDALAAALARLYADRFAGWGP